MIVMISIGGLKRWAKLMLFPILIISLNEKLIPLKLLFLRTGPTFRKHMKVIIS